MFSGTSNSPDPHVSKRSSLTSLFSSITPKQHEVMRLIAENRTSKEIAGQLGVTESAVNQRLEALRHRAGFPPRAELARAYRRYLDANLASRVFLDHMERFDNDNVMPREVDDVSLSNGADTAGTGQFVPLMFDGTNAAVNRLAAMVVIALGLMMTALVALGIAQGIVAVT